MLHVDPIYRPPTVLMARHDTTERHSMEDNFYGVLLQILQDLQIRSITFPEIITMLQPDSSWLAWEEKR